MNSRERYIGTFGLPQYTTTHVAKPVTIEDLRKMFRDADRLPKQDGPVVFVKLPGPLLQPAKPWHPDATFGDNP